MATLETPPVVMTIRQYAEQFKSMAGLTLGVYETFRDTPNPLSLITSFLNALPDTALGTFSGLFQTTSQMASFVVVAGPIIEQAQPETPTSAPASSAPATSVAPTS